MGGVMSGLRKGNDDDAPREEIIRWEVDNVSSMAPGSGHRYSPPMNIGGLEWQFMVTVESSARTSNIPYLGVFLVCTYPSSNRFWKCDSQYIVSLINREEDANTKGRDLRISKSFYPDSDLLGRGRYKIETWDNVMDDTQGFRQHDKIIVETSVTIKRTYGVGVESILRDFSEADETTDLCLIVEDKKVHVSKVLLALSSPVFKTMFYGKFEENGKDEIVVKDVKHKDFVALLNVIYTSLHEMTDDSVEGILNLADRFNVKIVLEAVGMYLKTDSRLEMAKKLLLTEKYKLEDAQEHLIYSMKTTAELKAIEASPLFNSQESYTHFNDHLMARIGQRMMELA